MFISNATITQILEKADIVDIIGEHIKLEKKGNDYKGICPFHDDSNPSLSVSPNKKIFKCFSCGETGNAITFIQKYKNLTFPEAVKYVGDKCGIEINLEKSATQQKNEKYYKIMQDATSYYQFFLKNSIEGKKALEYLYNRKLNDAIIKRFKIGLSSSEKDLLYESLTKKENPYLPIDLLNCGLINASKSDGYYDVFRNRIIFPIDDLNGNIVGFSGRIYTSDKKNEPKYLNTSENDIFKKGYILYNYSFAANEIKKKNKIFIFEGFMDVIAAYRANVLNTVATMGTALTDNHIKAIKKLTNNIVLCFDGDNAGITANKRAIQMFTKENMDVKVMLLPEGLDPDEYLDKYGEKVLNNFLENEAISSIDYLYSLELRQLIKDDINSVETFKRNIFAYLKIFKSKSLETQIVKRMSKDLSLNQEDITKDLNNQTSNKEVVEFVPKDNKNDNRVPLVEKKQYLRAERNLIYLALQKREYCEQIASLLPFTENIYVDKENRNLFWSIFDYYRQNSSFDYNNFYNSTYLNDELRLRLDDIFNNPLLFDENYANDFIKKNCDVLHNYNYEKEIERLSKSDISDDEYLDYVSILLKKKMKNK